MRDSFIFYRSFYESVSYLCDAERVLIYDAVMKYGLYQENEDELPPHLASLFTLIKPQLDANQKRYKDGKKGAKHGGKGGRPKKLKLNKKPNNNPSGVKTETPNKNVNVNVNENVNKNEDPPLPPKGNGVLNFKVEDFLTAQAKEAARREAPEWDINYLAGVYNEGVNSGNRDAPRKPNDAFPAWCGRYTKGKSP